MSKAQRIVTFVLWSILVLVMVGVIGAGVWNQMYTDRSGLPIRWDAPSFSLIDQNNRTITDRDLRGHPYVAAFIFTQCAGPCPMMSNKMASLQKTIRNSNVKLVSFSVDPERDTPAVLKEYADRFGADPKRWHFLTGPTASIYAVARGMQVAAKPADADSPILHATYFILVDGNGKVREIYHGDHSEPGMLERLSRDADLLASGGRGK
jgi:protein SCO1/2